MGHRHRLHKKTASLYLEPQKLRHTILAGPRVLNQDTGVESRQSRVPIVSIRKQLVGASPTRTSPHVPRVQSIGPERGHDEAIGQHRLWRPYIQIERRSVEASTNRSWQVPMRQLDPAWIKKVKPVCTPLDGWAMVAHNLLPKSMFDRFLATIGYWLEAGTLGLYCYFSRWWQPSIRGEGILEGRIRISFSWSSS